MKKVKGFHILIWTPNFVHYLIRLIIHLLVVLDLFIKDGMTVFCKFYFHFHPDFCNNQAFKENSETQLKTGLFVPTSFFIFDSHRIVLRYPILKKQLSMLFESVINSKLRHKIRFTHFQNLWLKQREECFSALVL